MLKLQRSGIWTMIAVGILSGVVCTYAFQSPSAEAQGPPPGAGGQGLPSRIADLENDVEMLLTLIEEQQAQIDDLQAQIDECCGVDDCVTEKECDLPENQGRCCERLDGTLGECLKGRCLFLKKPIEPIEPIEKL